MSDTPATRRSSGRSCHTRSWFHVDRSGQTVIDLGGRQCGTLSATQSVHPVSHREPDKDDQRDHAGACWGDSWPIVNTMPNRQGDRLTTHRKDGRRPPDLELALGHRGAHCESTEGRRVRKTMSCYVSVSSLEQQTSITQTRSVCTLVLACRCRRSLDPSLPLPAG